MDIGPRRRVIIVAPLPTPVAVPDPEPIGMRETAEADED